MKEPHITINGRVLNVGQTMTLRVALETFLMTLKDGLGNDAHGERMTRNYRGRGKEIRALMSTEHFVEPADSEPTRIQLNADGTWNRLD